MTGRSCGVGLFCCEAPYGGNPLRPNSPARNQGKAAAHRQSAPRAGDWAALGAPFKSHSKLATINRTAPRLDRHPADWRRTAHLGPCSRRGTRAESRRSRRASPDRPQGWRLGCPRRSASISLGLCHHKPRCSTVGSPPRGLTLHGSLRRLLSAKSPHGIKAKPPCIDRPPPGLAIGLPRARRFDRGVSCCHKALRSTGDRHPAACRCTASRAVFLVQLRCL